MGIGDSREGMPLGITMGCPAGVGPEVVIKAFAQRPEWLQSPNCVVLGDVAVLERAAESTGKRMALCTWEPGADLKPEAINVFQVTRLDPADVPVGTPTAVTGRASYEYVVKGIELCKQGLISGLVTAPISKTGLKMAGIQYPGHTEILSDMMGASSYAMMMAGRRLKVVLVTIHCPLREVPERISEELVLEKIRLTYDALTRDFGMDSPCLAVAGLNPHAGEGGIMGDEEERIISPAVRKARAQGLEVSGPYPPDTVFFRAAEGDFDAVVCQYHDQGLIPFKLLHFRDGVNVTIGLPFVRTSVDHGTAYDIAGRGTADCGSLEAAMDLAIRIVRNRSRHVATPGSR